MSSSQPPGHSTLEGGAPKLARRLGLFDATMIVMGGIVGSGIFINSYVVARQVHTAFLVLAAWIIGGVIALAGAFIYAELAARRPNLAGQYAYIRDAYHPAVAFVYGWGLLSECNGHGSRPAGLRQASCEAGRSGVVRSELSWLPPLQEALAARYSVAPDCVAAATPWRRAYPLKAIPPCWPMGYNGWAWRWTKYPADQFRGVLRRAG